MRDRIKKTFTLKRIIWMLVGNIGIGLGVTIFYFSGLGNDPFSGMNMILSERIGLSYGNFLLIVNTCLFLLELLFGKQYIQIGTLVNWIGIGYVVDAFRYLFTNYIPEPKNLFLSVLIMLSGVLVMSFSISVYQTADMGLAPFDSLAFLIRNHTPIPYFWARISVDALCAFICLFAGGFVGLGTFVCAFGLGPFIAFFNKHFSSKVLK